MKNFTKLWLASFKVAAKAQRQTQKRLLDSLLPQAPKPATPRRKAAKTASVSGVAAKSARTAAKPAPGPAFPVDEASRLPGKWMAYTYALSSPRAPLRRMPYWLYLPKSAAGPPLPLVVMLHGCEQTAPGFAQGTRMNWLAEREGFAVLYPQQTPRGHPQRCWHWYERHTQEGAEDAERIVGIVTRACASYAIDRSRIYIAGLSAGAGMAQIVALNHPELFAAVGLHSGAVFGASRNRAAAMGVMQFGGAREAQAAIAELLQRKPGFPGMPAILIHGREDRVVRHVNLEQLAAQFRVLNAIEPDAMRLSEKAARGGQRAAHAYRLQDGWRGRKLLLRVCEIHGLEHAWSGGDAHVKYHSGIGPDASAMMWDFFARHRRGT
ncbi:extracellular catalytic domain type 1 short-chain-length polyhydroxyalkanoate depolymerase [Noviherbaspirillum pedocola]|uniref:PHB depolymerase family esterase n=1 Tax=Noviherbaspirillum pedocola TaxID=2801341 RepID=A0A934W6K2_9BURK|nr:PHB depolymerase family esterase [Noviherbaspirillum pedocola]MBK4736332.1 PHB depolymerase family esterase [Noviherbaspirillum pedocola]